MNYIIKIAFDINNSSRTLFIMDIDDQTGSSKKNEFFKIIREFLPDLLHTFPEYKDNLHEGIIDILQNNVDTESAMNIYYHCVQVYPERFFDILYQNTDIFDNTDINTEFLPNIEFSTLWKSDVSDKTREIIWKYLQLILFSVISEVTDGQSFGDSAKLFEAIDEDELKNKLEQTLNEMQTIFDFSGNTEEPTLDGSNINLENLPDPESIHNHINSMLGGKLGALAREIAEETANDMNIDMDDATSINDVFQKLFRNPGKLLSMVKNIGTKIENKIKSGEIKESELIQEAGEMVSKMKSMPGMGNLQSMLGKFGLPTGKNSKINMGAFKSQLNQNLRKSKMRERLQKRLAERQMQAKLAQMATQSEPSQSGETTFVGQEPPERTPRVRGANEDQHKKRKRKKRRKKKNKK